MKIIVHIIGILAALSAIALVNFHGLLLTVFTANREFMFSAQSTSAAIIMLTLGILMRRKVRRSITVGASLFFSVCSIVVLLTHFGMQEGYVAHMEIGLPYWHYQVYFYSTIAFPVIPAFLLFRREPNKTTTDNLRGVAPAVSEP